MTGTNEGVAAATAHVNAYFRSVTNLIRNVTMVLTAAQREKLTSSDLTRYVRTSHAVQYPCIVAQEQEGDCFHANIPHLRSYPYSTMSPTRSVKEIQGAAGVHIVLNPLGEDISDTVSSFDLRLPHTDFNQANGMYASRTGPGPDPNVRSVPLITVRVLGLTGGSTEVSVVANNAGGANGERMCHQ